VTVENEGNQKKRGGKKSSERKKKWTLNLGVWTALNIF